VATPKPSGPRPHVTDAELGVLEVLWDEAPVTIRSITDRLYPSGGNSAYATVQKLLERLEDKHVVKRDRRSIPHRFRAIVDRDGLITGRLRDVADALCGGSMSPLLTSLIEHGELSDDELAELRRLVRRLDRRRKDA